MHRFSARGWMVVSLGLVAVVMVAAGCGDDDGPTGSGGPPQNTLVFTREDGTAIAFSPTAQAYVWCGSWEAGVVDTPSLHVYFASLDVNTPTASWWLRAVLADITEGDTLWFPSTFIWDDPDSADLFVADPPNELSTDGDDSSGYIVFHQLPCENGSTVDFSIDAVLDSEYWNLPSVSVTGRFRGNTTGRPW